jgi:predicted nucleic acid-binding protein
LRIYDKLTGAGEDLLVHSYVVVETASLLQTRAGHDASVRFLKDIAEIETVWVDADIQRDAFALFYRLKSRTTSLVDCASFIVMRRRGLTTAFAFDKHFTQQGFKLAIG